MAAVGSSAKPYAAFTSLSGAALRLPGCGSGGAAATLPHRLATAGYGEDRVAIQHLEAFTIARDMLEEHSQWEARQAEAVALRAERRELMRISTGAADSRPAAGLAAAVASTNPASRPSKVDAAREDALKQVQQATGLSPQQARQFLDQNDWKVDQAILSATAPASTSDQVTFEVTLPGGRCAAPCFQLNDGGFEVYTKIFDLLLDKETHFEMRLSGPKANAARSVNDKLLDESTWSDTLSRLGLVGGNTYELVVTQG